MKNYFLLSFLTAFLLVGCRGDEIRQEARNNKNNASGMYLDYKVWANEGNLNVTCLLRFRQGGPNGVPVRLEAPSQVQLDGKVLKANSTPFTGTYYEAVLPVDGFAGPHEIVFTGKDRKKYTEKFEFVPFTLADEPPAKLKKQPFTLRFKNVDPEGVTLHLAIIDTAFAGNDVNQDAKLRNGGLTVDERMLNPLSKGPVLLHISGDKEQALKNSPGRMVISYSLKRELELF